MSLSVFSQEKPVNELMDNTQYSVTEKYLDRTNAALVMIIFCVGVVWLLSVVIHNTRDKFDNLTDIL